ncbi:MAG: ATP-binding cassette domain-containing protein [Woeseiaceae bacterium]|nr:ATP-binding cassette domain-containing protein [Woeseiaceae bacterium]
MLSHDISPQSDSVEVIRLEDVRRRYTMGLTHVDALAGVDLLVQGNEYLAIMGASGSGKSTLMNVIGCLDTPTGGEYWLNGQHVSHMSDRELAGARNREIGFVFQMFNLLPRHTALANVEVPLVYAGMKKKERDERAKHALEIVGLSDRTMHRPSEMSGGQRQRVAIARALVTEPSILLADEPTGNLDSTTSRDIMVLFDDLHAAGHTLIVVTHEHYVAEHAKRVIWLSDGKVISDSMNGAGA